jgi:hypothetical protein
MSKNTSNFWMITSYILALIMFAIGYGLCNQHNLVHGILYRAAANDYRSAIEATMAMGVQAAFLCVSLVLVSRRMFWIFLLISGFSVTINSIFGQILNNTIDYTQFSWLISESRQASNAAGQFTRPVIIAIAKTISGLSLFAMFRYIMGHTRMLGTKLGTLSDTRQDLFAICLFLLPSAAFILDLPGPRGSERNIYEFAGQLAVSPPPPSRESVRIQSDTSKSIGNIVWIVDESINYSVFSEQVKPQLAKFNPVDFGMAASLGNCSASSNMALRSGVSIDTLSDKTDLRKTPSIWGYAKKAGYRTVLLDGQVEGPPQNLLFEPELKLIDEYHSKKSGIRTDLHLATVLNKMLRSNKRQFIYVVLRGVHFQYSDHYPNGSINDTAPLSEKYAHAVQYSKAGFFDALLSGVDRDTTAIVYTSDHGQNVKEGVLPHCAANPSAEEFKIPLIAFVPDHNQAPLRKETATRSAAQIFPTTLEWMGYRKTDVAIEFDNDLESPPKRFIWFGKAVIPSVDDEQIDLHVGSRFPATLERK